MTVIVNSLNDVSVVHVNISVRIEIKKPTRFATATFKLFV